VDELQSIGITASRRDTPGHPMVVGHSEKVAGRPSVLFYGHYDVQPVDPLDLWDRDPFDPAIEKTPDGEVIRARGAADDKGQLMTFIEACRAWQKVDGALPVNVTFLFEGEDMFGGPSANPVRLLTKILAGLHDDDGRVTINGFYDGVDPLPAQVKAQWDALNFDESEFLGAVDLSVNAGEKGYTALEQICSRPTCEFNGIEGGYTGEGFKTVLPSKASAKISFRLVGNQDPFEIRKNFRAYVKAQNGSTKQSMPAAVDQYR